MKSYTVSKNTKILGKIKAHNIDIAYSLAKFKYGYGIIVWTLEEHTPYDYQYTKPNPLPEVLYGSVIYDKEIYRVS